MMLKIPIHELTQPNHNFILLTDMFQAPPGTLIWQVVTHHYKIYYSLVSMFFH